MKVIGKTISHYRILEKLGEGGMGVVYRAEDVKLGREVALKFLPPESTRDPDALARFEREARAAAALNSQNICTIYEIDEADGQTFIAMELLCGDTLEERISAGPLEPADALEIAIQIAGGLAAAHAKGVVHRDMKPANVMITSDGRAKIMDFGLAALDEGVELTRPGTTLGTVPYMSPEQARGEGVDHRADLWALGVILYESLAGKRPFVGEYRQAVIHSILNTEPERLSAVRSDVPADLERVVERALEKNPDARYQDAADMAADLKPVLSGLCRRPGAEHAPEDRPSIAVLPFADMSPERDQEYFCEGMAEELINALTSIGKLRVASRTSAFQFHGKGHDIHEVGRKLNVDTVLEGSVRKAGNRLRVTVQLIKASDGYHLWSEKFDRDAEDIFAIQDEISLAIVDKLKLKLLGDEKRKLVKRHTDDVEAHNLYLKGRYFWSKRSEGALRKAIECFEQAIEKDPEYALAYSGLADAYICMDAYTTMSPIERTAKAAEAATRALDLDDSLAEAHASMAVIKMEAERDWAGAEREFKRAIDLNPDYATARSWYGNLLEMQGRPDDAIREMERSLELDPLSLVTMRNLAATCVSAGRLDKAEKMVTRLLDLDPTYAYGHSVLAWVYWRRSLYSEAIEELEVEKGSSPDPSPILDCWKGRILAEMGKTEEAESVRAELSAKAMEVRVPRVAYAALCFELGKVDEGFEWLEKGYEEGSPDMNFMLVGVELPEPIKSHPRLLDIARRMGLAK